MPLRTVALSALIWLSGLAVACGWSRQGHEAVARLAWQGLDESARGRLYTLLRAHPAFRHWREEARTASDVRLFVLQRAAAWPDDIRRKGPDNPYRLDDASLVHADWHYVDHVVCFDGTRSASASAPSPNVIDGLRASVSLLRDASRSRAQRAVALAWVLHLVGDIHQPLHCAERFSRALPHGDRGGNQWMVRRPDGSTTNLHALWDTMTDGLPVASADGGAALRTSAAGARASTDTDFRAWSWEGAKLAREVAYDRGRLPGAPIVDREPPPQDVPALSADYVAAAQRVAQRRLRLAACRLHALLETCTHPRR